MQDPATLRHKVAIVTGVSRGLGEALAARLLDDGWSVLGVGRSASPRLDGPRFSRVAADLADTGATNDAVETAMRQAATAAPSRVLLINNAAVADPVGRLGGLEQNAIVASLTVNLLAPVVLANLFCRVFDDTGVARRIVNVTSGLASRAIAGASLYSIGKCAMEMLTRALAVDHPEPSFSAITLRPGIIDTDMQVYLRGRAADELPDVAMFRKFYHGGELVAADHVATAVVANLVERGVESGRTYNYAELGAIPAISASDA